jgi:hypothetical protein
MAIFASCRTFGSALLLSRNESKLDGSLSNVGYITHEKKRRLSIGLADSLGAKVRNFPQLIDKGWPNAEARGERRLGRLHQHTAWA